MKAITKQVVIYASSLLLLTGTASIKAESGHDHHDHKEHSATEMVLNDGKKWKTDAPLRQGMQKINDAVMSAVDAYHHDTLTQKAADKVSEQINIQVNYLIKNCKLVPEADATLHVLIADLLSAAEKIKADPASSEGMPGAVQSLIAYAKYFEHDGWKVFND